MTHHYSLLPFSRARRKPLLLVLAAVLSGFLLFLHPVPLLAQDAGTMVYTVKAGETLTEIAAQFGVEPQDLLDLNGLENADAIFVGQTLRVPVTVDASQPAPPGTYRVQPGETLWSIAIAYKTTIAELKAINRLTSDDIYPGDTLLIVLPKPTSTPEPTATSTPYPSPTPFVFWTITSPPKPTSSPVPASPVTGGSGMMIVGFIVVAALVAAGAMTAAGARKGRKG